MKIKDREITLEELINIALNTGAEKAFMVLSENLIEMNERMGQWNETTEGGSVVSYHSHLNGVPTVLAH